MFSSHFQHESLRELVCDQVLFVLLIVGGIGGVMTKRAAGAASKMFNPPTQPMCQPMGYQGSMGGFNSSYAPPQSAYGLPSQPFGAMPVWKNPELDESWTPGPPPTTPPDHLEETALWTLLAYVLYVCQYIYRRFLNGFSLSKWLW